MKRLPGVALIISLSFTGCSVGLVNMETTLREQPFAVEQMQGSVTEATRCVSRHWQKSVLPAGIWWKANPESLPIIVSGVGIGRWEPPVSLVIDFGEVDGKTLARAYLHRSFSKKDERQAVTTQSLAACRDNTRHYYGEVTAIVLKNGDVIEGQIISVDNDVLKIRTREGKLLSYSFINDVKKYIYKMSDQDLK